MIHIAIFLIPIFTVWSGTADTGYEQHMVFISTDIATDCQHKFARGCVNDLGLDTTSIIVENPFEWSATGCNVLTHEWFHLYGYSEAQIPICNDLLVPDYMMEYLPDPQS